MVKIMDLELFMVISGLGSEFSSPELSRRYANVIVSVLVPKAPHFGQAEMAVFVVDWEMCQIGAQALDLGQMIAELYETKLFKNVNCGVWVIEGLLEGYGPLSEEMAFRTAIHVGVHLVVWGSTVAGWGSEQQIKEVVEVGRDFIVHGWNKNRAWFEGGALECLFNE